MNFDQLTIVRYLQVKKALLTLALIQFFTLNEYNEVPNKSELTLVENLLHWRDRVWRASEAGSRLWPCPPRRPSFPWLKHNRKCHIIHYVKKKGPKARKIPAGETFCLSRKLCNILASKNFKIIYLLLAKLQDILEEGNTVQSSDAGIR